MSRTREPKKRAKLEDELHNPPLPSFLAYLWRIFVRLADRRSTGLNGPNLITYTEMQAFQELAGIRLTPWEVEMIEALDKCHLSELHRTRQE